jgi:fructokinase
MSDPLYGLLEAGGTKFVLGVATGKEDIRASTRIPTTSPAETIGATMDWFAAQGPLAHIGIATFGPVGLDPSSPDWGHILDTPKPGWSGADLVGPLQKRFARPVAIDTDVNAVALAESIWGAGQGLHSVLYFTVGTGIGGGAVIGNRILQGQSHPEMGHMRVPRHRDDTDFAGVCPFHGDCLEGLASGPAIIARWGNSLSDLPDTHPAHHIVAFYLAQASVNMQAIFEPGRIIFGGGVMHTPGLIERVRSQASQLAAGYFRSKSDEVICGASLGANAGLVGALSLILSSTS